MNSILGDKIYTHNIAATILDIFDDFLCDKGIIVPSVDDDQREPDNTAALYGTEYSDLLDMVEEYLIVIAEKTKKDNMEIVPFIFK